MNLGKLFKSMLAITAAGLTLSLGTGCDEKKQEAAPAAHSGGKHAASAPQMTSGTPAPESAAATLVANTDAGQARLIEMEVTEDGYRPKEIHVRKGEPLLIRITRKTDQTCAFDLIVGDNEAKVALPLNQQVELAYTPSKSGQIKFGCAMDKMISGVLVVDEA